MIEEWKNIEGYEGLYQVSSLGRIKSFDRIIKYKKNNKIITYLKKGRIMKPHNNGRDYLNVSLIKKVEYYKLEYENLLTNRHLCR